MYNIVEVPPTIVKLVNPVVPILLVIVSEPDLLIVAVTPLATKI
jgi:hypothetical protein